MVLERWTSLSALFPLAYGGHCRVSSEQEHTHAVSTCGRISQRSDLSLCCCIQRRDIKSINGALHSCKFSHSVIFLSRQERCENRVDSEAEVHGKTGTLLITATDDGPFWNCVSGRFY